MPYVRNYFKNERLYRILERPLLELIREERSEIVHAQHVLSGPPSIAAARRAGIPSVCTVRDYWPVCYWSDLIVDRDSEALCPACTSSMMTQCVRPRAGAAWPLALPMIPYMRANLARKREALARADAVVAVSSAIAADLRVRAPEVDDSRIHVIPNAVDVAALRASVASSARPIDEPYLLYVGKLAPNKGVSKLLAAVDAAPLSWPLVIVGDGPERARLEGAAAASGRTVRFEGWLARKDALAWLAHAGVLVFPSHGPESLSRVLLEASALGIAIAAMVTGGTRDIITHGVTGLLSTTADGLRGDVGTLASDGALRRRLGDAAAAHVASVFDAPIVIAAMESLYGTLAARTREGRDMTLTRPGSHV